MTFAEFKKELAADTVGCIYLFDGEDSYFMDRGLSLLRERVQMPELNYSEYNGAELKGEAYAELFNAARSYPFLSDKRMIRVNNFYPTESEYTNYVKPYFDSPCDSTVLAFINTAKTKTKAARLTSKSIKHVVCNRLDEMDVARWIYSEFKRAGLEADGNVCQTVANYCLCYMSRVSVETQKLIDYAHGNSLTVSDLDGLIVKEEDYKLYEMTNAAARGDYKTYLSILEDFRQKGMDETEVISTLMYSFKRLYEISEYSSVKTDAQIAALIGVKEYAVKKSKEQIRKIGAARVRELYTALSDASASIRCGASSKTSALAFVNAKLLAK